MVGPDSSYVTTSINLRILWSLKPHHFVNGRIPSGEGGDGDYTKKNFSFLYLCRSFTNVASTSSLCIFHYYVPCVFLDTFQFLLKTIGSSDEKLQEASAGCLSNIRKLALAAENFNYKQYWWLLLQLWKVPFLFLKLYKYLDVCINKLFPVNVKHHYMA